MTAANPSDRPTDAPPTPRAAPSVRTILLLNLLPTLIFAVAVVISSAAVIGWQSASTSHLAVRLERGTLTAAHLRDLGGTLNSVWIAGLGAFLAATAIGPWCSRRATRRLLARLEGVARETGARLGMLRATATDPLTGVAGPCARAYHRPRRRACQDLPAR